jgi:hypothetical protein
MSTRTLLFVILLVFAITLAIVVGNRLATDALPIAFGIAVGITVGMPTSVLVAILTRQVTFGVPVQVMPAQEWPASGNGHAPSERPNGKQPASRRARPAPTYEAVPAPPSNGRHFTVVGGASAPSLERDLPGNGGFR